MAFSAQQNFVAEIDGTTVMELNKKLDYKITSLEDRKKLVEDILNNTKFYEGYFSDYFKAGLTTRDALSSDVNVCKSLNAMANYLLNSKEIKQMDDSEETKYVFYTDEHQFEKKIRREVSIEGFSTDSDDSSENVIHFLKRETKNHKKPKTQKILKKDLARDDFLGEVLRSYQAFNEFITEELKKGKNSKHSRFLLSKIKNQIDNDMIYSKDHLLGVWGYDLKAFSESTVLNVDVFDFSNVKHLHGTDLEIRGKRVFAKGLLYFKPTDDYTDDFNLVLIDLKNLIKRANLTAIEELILAGVQSGLPKKVVAEMLNVNPMKITRTMILIAEKVAALGNKYDCEKEIV